MDLSTLSGGSGYTLELKHPATGEVLVDDEGVTMTITVVGVDSDQFRKAERDFRIRAITLAKKEGGSMTPEEQADYAEKEMLNRLVACTVDMHIQLSGEIVSHSPTKTAEIYHDYPWIKEQVEEAVNNRANFFAA